MAELAAACPRVRRAALADDEFCESCGTPIGRRNAAREHVEVDAGLVAGVSDRGLRHERNEDAVFVAADGRGPSPSSATACRCRPPRRWPRRSPPRPPASGSSSSSAARRRTARRRRDGGGARPRRRRGRRRAVDGVAGPQRPVVHGRGRRLGRDVVTVGWAGDSRAYWIDADGVRLLTADHSWAQEQVATGAMTAAAAELDPRAHAITRWLGDDAPDAADDRRGRPRSGPARAVHRRAVEPARGPDELAGWSSRPATARRSALARRLVSTALGRGGHDNVTVAVIEVEPGEG